MRVQAFTRVGVDQRLEREALQTLGEGLATLFDIAVPRERTALLLASDNAGSASSVQFWADAKRTGVALASPELFPWCLANAPCGALARRFGITGPNSTLLGQADALAAAFDAAADLFTRRQVDAALIVAVSFADACGAGVALGLHLVDGGSLPAPPAGSLRRAIDALADRLATPG